MKKGSGVRRKLFKFGKNLIDKKLENYTNFSD